MLCLYISCVSIEESDVIPLNEVFFYIFAAVGVHSCAAFFPRVSTFGFVASTEDISSVPRFRTCVLLRTYSSFVIHDIHVMGCVASLWFAESKFLAQKAFLWMKLGLIE